MGSEAGQSAAGATGPDAGSGIDRRRFLRVAAAATGVVWAAPAVTSLGIPAYAQTSPPPGEVEVLPGVQERGPTGGSTSGPTEVAGAVMRRAADGLPVTGPSLAGIAAAGAGAVVAGSAAVRASKRRRSGAEPEPSDGHLAEE